MPQSLFLSVVLLLHLFLGFDFGNSECSERTHDSKLIWTLFENVANKPSEWIDICDLCTWDPNRIVCIDNSIVAIDLNDMSLTGSLTLTDTFPINLFYLSLRNNYLYGDITALWKQLPSKLEWLDLGYNNFTGQIDWSNTPSALYYLYLSYNRLQGTIPSHNDAPNLQYLYLTQNLYNIHVDWEELPRQLKYLYLAGNFLFGDIATQNIPINLTRLHLGNNNFHGNVLWESLPSSLEYLLLHSNVLLGSIDCDILPPNLIVLSLANNSFTSLYNLHQSPSNLQELYLSQNNLVGLIDFSQLPSNLKSFFADDNRLTGKVYLDQLPPNLERLWLYGNNLNGSELDFSAIPQLLEQILLFSNNIFGSISLTNLNMLPNLKVLALHDNNITGPIDFHTLSNDLNLTLDLNVYCDVITHCSASSSMVDCVSLERTAYHCMGPNQCSDTCVCLGDNCTLQFNMSTYPKTIKYPESNWHSLIENADFNEWKEIGDEISGSVDITEFKQRTLMTTTTTTAIATTNDANKKGLIASWFGSEIIGYIAIVAFCLGVCVCGILIWWVNCRKAKQKKIFTTSFGDGEFETAVKSDQELQKIASQHAVIGQKLAQTSIQIDNKFSENDKKNHLDSMTFDKDIIKVADNANNDQNKKKSPQGVKGNSTESNLHRYQEMMVNSDNNNLQNTLQDSVNIQKDTEQQKQNKKKKSQKKKEDENDSSSDSSSSSSNSSSLAKVHQIVQNSSYVVVPSPPQTPTVNKNTNKNLNNNTPQQPQTPTQSGFNIQKTKTDGMENEIHIRGSSNIGYVSAIETAGQVHIGKIESKQGGDVSNQTSPVLIHTNNTNERKRNLTSPQDRIKEKTTRTFSEGSYRHKEDVEELYNNHRTPDGNDEKARDLKTTPGGDQSSSNQTKFHSNEPTSGIPKQNKSSETPGQSKDHETPGQYKSYETPGQNKEHNPPRKRRDTDDSDSGEDLFT